MPVLSTFTNPQGGGQLVNRYVEGLDASRSLMDRADANSRANAEEARKQQSYQVLAPLQEAQAKAETAKSVADYAAIGQLQEAKRAAYETLPTARSEFNDLMKITDDKERSAAARQYLGKYSQLANISELKGEMDQRNHVAASVIQDSMKLELLDAKNQAMVDAAQVRADAQAKMAEERDARARELATERAQHQAELINIRTKAAGTNAYLTKMGKDTATMVSDLQTKLPAHYETLDQIARAREALASDAEQGKGTQTLLGLKQVVNAFAPNTFDTTKNEEILKNSYASMALTAAAKMKGQGQITENERALLANTVAQFGNSKEGALYVMSFMEGLAKREIARAETFNEIAKKDDGIVTFEDNAKFFRDNPISKFITTPEPEPKPGEAKKSDAKVPLKIHSIEKA